MTNQRVNEHVQMTYSVKKGIAIGIAISTI